MRKAPCLHLAIAIGLALETTALAAAAARAPLDLKVAGVDRGVVIALVLDDDVWIPADDLSKAGIKFPHGAVRSVAGEAYVSLKALAPAVTYAYDVATLSVDVRIVTAGAIATRGTHADLSTANLQTQQPTTVTSGFLGYDLIESVAKSASGQLGGFFEAGFSESAGRFDATNDLDSTGFHRGLYAFTFDNDQSMSTVVLGDSLADTSNPLSSNVVIGGLTVSRNFSLQPDFIRYPTAGFSGTALSPAQADIYVNGGLYRTVQLQPGPFQLQDLNLPVGMNVTQIVLHDAFGNVTQFGAAPFYSAQTVLAKGVTSYNYQLGFVRLNPFGSDDVYGPLATVGFYRLGVTSSVTAGGAFEASPGIVDGGPSFSARTGFGQFDVAASLSDTRGVTGNAEDAAYSYINGRISAQATLLLQTSDYATIALPITSDRATVATAESFEYRFSPRTSVSLAHADTHNRVTGPSDQTIGSVNFQSGGQGTWTLSLERNRGSFLTLNPIAREQNNWATGIGYQVNVGRTGYLQVQTSAGNGQGLTAVSYSQSAANSPGQVGYTATAQSGEGDRSFFESAQYRANNFDVLEQATDATGGTSASFGVSGAVAFFNQGIFFTSPLQDGYGLVHVSGPSGLPVSLGGTVQGTTDDRGYIVVPGMTPYIDNRVEVGGLDTLPEYQIDSSEKIAVPRNDSATALDFDVSKVQLFVGTVVLRRGEKALAPSYGVFEIVGVGGTYSSDIGENGEFFFESIKPGKYRGTIRYGTEVPCLLDFIVPTSTEFKVDLGAHTCVEPSR